MTAIYELFFWVFESSNNTSIKIKMKTIKRFRDNTIGRISRFSLKYLEI